MYLILKCLHEPSVTSYLNIADFYLEKENNNFLCFLSDLAVLRLDPVDEKSYNRAALYAKDYFDNREFLRQPEIIENSCAISVIMPTFNRGEKVRESVESVLSQEFDDFELVVVNDGGSDEVESFLNQIDDSKIRYLKITHAGLAGALNAGLKHARGEYIAYLDDDDIYYANHLKILYEFAEKTKKDFVFSKNMVVRGIRDDFGNFLINRSIEKNISSYSKAFLASNLGISVLNVLHKRSLVFQVGLFNAKIPWSMDWELWMRMSDICEPTFVNKATGEYRISSENMTTSSWYKGAFYMHHLFRPFFVTGYGSLILYQSARRLKDKDKSIWLEKLSRYYVSQDELFQTVCISRDLLLEFGFLKNILTNRYKHEYSYRKLVLQILLKIKAGISKIVEKVLLP